MIDIVTGRNIRTNIPDDPINRKKLDKFEMDVVYGNVLMDREV